MTKQQCTALGCTNESRYTPFRVGNLSGEGTNKAHVRSHDWICTTHAILLLKNDSSVLGVLNREEAKLYESRRNGDHALEYREHGYTLVDLKDFSAEHLMKENICSRLIDRILGKACGGQLYLTFLANRYCRADGTPSSENIRNTNDGRTWLNIIPGEYHSNKDPDWIKWFRSDVDHLGMIIEERLFPHPFYARKAKYNGERLKAKGNEERLKDMEYWGGHPDRSVKPNYEEIIDMVKVNVLAKGRCLKERQSMRVDGSGFKVVVILVHICGKAGYDFKFVPLSHNLLQNHKGERNQKIPITEIESICFPRSKILVFSENLIHGGGESKMSKEEYSMLVEGKFVNGVCLPRKEGQLYDVWKLEGGGCDPVLAGDVELPEQPTELSFQVTYDFRPLSEGNDEGKAKPFWYKNEVNDNIEDGTLGKREDYIQSVIQSVSSNCFGEKIDTQAEAWIKNLTSKNGNRHLRAKRHRGEEMHLSNQNTQAS